MSEDEKQFLECYRKMREIYPDDDLILCNPKTYFGYDIEKQTAVRIEIVEFKG